MFKRIQIVGFLLLLIFPALLAGQTSRAGDIARRMDELYRADSSRALVEMEIVTPHWSRTLKMETWSEGMDKTLIRILEPKKEEGMATLRIGNEMWNYLPNTNKVMKIPPSMMMGSWMGSDFTNDDLVKEFSFIESYTFEMTSIEDSASELLYVKCVPKEGLPIVWGHVIIAVRESDKIPVWQRFYDEKGSLMREITYTDIKTIGGRTIPATMELVPLNKEGQKTSVRFLEASFNISPPSDTFTLRNLRKGP
ncbi:MAG: outer membrane lipoprotein-sorting protein [Candidatus Aminicenantes bacterium]|nr:outer membrane lipoprotein-sorting protein [Candidatus Aminicenantes bacterium]